MRQAFTHGPPSLALTGIMGRIREYWLWAAVLAAASVVFFGAPGSYTGTSHAILHGLCAQTPSHTVMFGGEMLPFDARMTGIYGGFLVTLVSITIAGRLFHYGNPPKRAIALLAVLVGLMAVDGFNSLLTDLMLWHPYESGNGLRVATGYGTGVALAVVLSWLLASSAWNLGSPRAAIGRLRDLLAPGIGLVAYGVLLFTSPGALHFPVSMLLVLSAWITITMLMLVIVLLALKLDSQVRQVRHLHVPVAISALLAVSVMIGLAGARFWAERTFGISNAMM
ncbi:MAG: DUF2085 domain-containing protein [Chloroflexota bacterium]|nr:DUF2085 domain-containing protein [Chloroflexota bacterium]